MSQSHFYQKNAISVLNGFEAVTATSEVKRKFDKKSLFLLLF